MKKIIYSLFITVLIVVNLFGTLSISTENISLNDLANIAIAQTENGNESGNGRAVDCYTITDILGGYCHEDCSIQTFFYMDKCNPGYGNRGSCSEGPYELTCVMKSYNDPKECYYTCDDRKTYNCKPYN